MKRFVEAIDRSQAVMFPARLDDYVDEENPVRAVTERPIAAIPMLAGYNSRTDGPSTMIKRPSPILSRLGRNRDGR